MCAFSSATSTLGNATPTSASRVDGAAAAAAVRLLHQQQQLESFNCGVWPDGRIIIIVNSSPGPSHWPTLLPSTRLPPSARRIFRHFLRRRPQSGTHSLQCFSHLASQTTVLDWTTGRPPPLSLSCSNADASLFLTTAASRAGLDYDY